MMKFGPQHFFKFHGTGNDFILIFQRNVQNKCKQQLAKKLCHRKYGIGADGLLIIRQHNSLYKMEIINSDGSMANMCGNGLRCFSALLFKLKLIDQECKILTDDGIKDIKVKTISSLNISETNFQGKQFEVSLNMGKGGEIKQIQINFVNVQEPKAYYTVIGVPHIVLFLTDTEFNSINFQLIGAKIQQLHDANINFCCIQDQKNMKVTTYERGAGLTYSCGTGVCSSVFIAYNIKNMKDTVKVQTSGGILQISIKNQNQILMKGPAQQICQGQYYI